MPFLFEYMQNIDIKNFTVYIYQSICLLATVIIIFWYLVDLFCIENESCDLGPPISSLFINQEKDNGLAVRVGSGIIHR